MTGKKQRLGIGFFLWVLFIIGISVQQVSAFDFSAPYTNVQAWIDGSRVYVKVYDTARSQWMETNYSSSSPHELTNRDGVVAWFSYNDNSYVHYTVYDPVKGQWQHSSRSTFDAHELTNRDGVVAWISYNDNKYVHYTVYDPVKAQWQHSSRSTFDAHALTNRDGVVAWISYNDNKYVNYTIYDPVNQTWYHSNSSGYNISSLSISAATVSYWSSGNSYTRGYNYQSRSWSSGSPTVPLAKFVPSPPWEDNGLHYIHFADMSIGGTSYSWNFGDGGYSNEQTPYHIFSLGAYTVTQSIYGPFGNDSVSEQVVTDHEAPSGTVSIENGAPTTISLNVTLYLSATDNSGSVESMRFSYNNNNYGDWQPYAPTASFTFSPGTGVRYVYAQFRDQAGNVSNTVNDSIYMEVPHIRITEPDPLEILITDTPFYIHWTSAGDINDVRIHYSINGGSNWISITTSTPNTGSYPWSVPNTPSTSCRILIEDNGSTLGDATGLFTIAVPSITVTSPAAGVTLLYNQPQNITWTHLGPIDAVDIDYSTDGGNNWQLIASGYGNTHTFAWTAPTIASNNYMIRVQDTGGLATGYSGVFTVTAPPPSITVTSPAAGATLYQEAIQTVSWNYESIDDSTPVSLHLLQDGVEQGTIAENILISQGQYSWSVGRLLENPASPGSNFSVRVQTMVTPTTQGQSSAFTIAAPTLAFTSPNGGETLLRGAQCLILWDTENMSGNVHLSLYKNGANHTYIDLVNVNTGSYTWTIPADLPAGNDYTIRINRQAVEDFSDAVFTISDIPAAKIEPDFNNDGQPDFLWRSPSNGLNMVWYMNGVTKNGDNAWLQTLDHPDWNMMGTGDFNNDGDIDILWRNNVNGTNMVWYMDGITKSGDPGWLQTLDNQDWDIAGTGDFNNDGHTDVLWRNNVNGTNMVWYLNGVTKTGDPGWLPTLDNQDWAIAGTGDFNFDGHTDILWRNQVNGTNMIWTLNGISKTGTVWLPTQADTNWQLRGTADFNGDGCTDILWRYQGEGANLGKNTVWYLNGATQIAEVDATTMANLDWHIMNK